MAKTEFSEVPVGDYFRYQNKLYRKLHGIIKVKGKTLNAVDMDFSDIYTFPEKTVVYPVNARLIEE